MCATYYDSQILRVPFAKMDLLECGHRYVTIYSFST